MLYEFIQTLANEGRNLEFMLQPDGNYVSPMVLLLGNKFTQHHSHKTHNITLLTKIFSQSQFPKGNANDGNCPITQNSLDGQALVCIKTVDGNLVSNPRPFVYSVSGAIQLLCCPMSEANSRQQIEGVLFRRP